MSARRRLLRIALLVAGWLILPAVAHAAAIAHAFTEQNTAQTSTSTTYGDISGAAITSGNFTAGKKYLLYITAQITTTGGAALAGIQTVHGSTAFAESEMVFQPSVAGERVTYVWLTVWTAVSAEGITLQHKTSANTVSTDQISLFAMNLSDDLTENTDWFFNERSTDDALVSASFTDGATVTFTPGTASETWLVLSYMQDDPSAIAALMSRIGRSGEASSSTPSSIVAMVSASELPVLGHARSFVLAASSNTFTEQASAGADSSHTRLHSSIFVLNLNKFRNFTVAYTDADTGTLSTTNYATEIQTLSITPSVTSDTWIGGAWVYDKSNASRKTEFRVQLDGTDQPSAQTTDNYQFSKRSDAGDTAEDAFVLSTLSSSLSVSAHTVDMDASHDGGGAGTPTAQHRQLWAVTMELAAGADGAGAGTDIPGGSRSLLGVGR